MLHHRPAQPVLELQGEFPVRPELESQVGDRVRRRHPVPGVFEVAAEAQLQTRDSLGGGHGALAGVEFHHPQVRGHRLHAVAEVVQRVGHHQQVVYICLDESPLGLSWRA